MKQMIIPKKNRSRIYTVLDIVAILLIFVMAFAVGFAVMQLVYGYPVAGPAAAIHVMNNDNAFDFNASTAYHEVMNATNNASQYALNLNATR